VSRRPLAFAAGLVALYLLAAGSLAARAPLWNDELYTWYFAQLPTMADVWDKLGTGVEQIPPLYYVLVRGSLGLFGDDQLALRLPSMLGFLLAIVCVFVAVARRTSAWYGFVAALIPLATGAFTYAWEARPYALVVGFAAAAVLCQQLHNDGIRPRLTVVLLAGSLAAATAMHYYGVLTVFPIALAEAVRARERRRVDWNVVAALFAPLVPLAVSTTLLLDARKYAGAFWTDFDAGSAPGFFVFLLRADVFSPTRVPTWLGVGFAVVVLGGAVAVLVRRPRFAQTEIAAGIGFTLLPAVGVLVATLVTGAYVERYVLAAVIGPALLLPLALSRLSRGSRGAAITAAAVLVAWFGVLFQYWQRDIGVDLDRRERLISFLEESAPATGDIAVAHPHDYLELAHFAPPELAARLVRLSDPELALRYTGSRSTEDGLVVLSGFAPLRIVPYSRRSAPILLLRTVRGDDPDWVVEALADDGAHVRTTAEDAADGFTLERVEPAR
jgi:4-amino-4-deoxy-L-arabinose transferase-like glycosyltransferase